MHGGLISGAQVRSIISRGSQNNCLPLWRWYPTMNHDPDALLGVASWAVEEIPSKHMNASKKTAGEGTSFEANIL